MPKFIQNSSQFSSVATQFMGSNSWMGVSPVNRQAVVPKVLTFQAVSWFNTWIKTMYFTSTIGHAYLKLSIITPQPIKKANGNSIIIGPGAGH